MTTTTASSAENGIMPSQSPISTDMVQVVNYEEDFNHELQSFLNETRITPLGFDYHVAAIMGPQSSGKSTLLNLLFGTKFRTMDESSGRYQVTQGVWLGRDADAGIIVMDLEGTDSRERGEEAANYERKSALFALALAEVLIVNVWAQDVGRYNAANMSLLKTVMELDLQLFFGGAAAVPPEGAEHKDRISEGGKPRMHKTRLLFVLRDHVSSPFETLCNTLRTDVDNIWNTISKPDAARDTPITNYFDIDFFALPHKVLMADMFQSKGAELRRRFHENEVFLEEYSRGVAADGFAAYAEGVWETIRANRELDIPSQKEMLAHVRCEQIAKEATLQVDETLAPMKAKLLPSDGSPADVVAELFPTLLAASDTAVESYEASAFRYSATVAEVKGSDMRAKIGGDCKALFDAQVALASDLAVSSFRSQVSASPVASTPTASKPWKNWGAVSKGALDEALKKFDELSATDSLSANADKISGAHPLSFAIATSSGVRRRLCATLDTEMERATADVVSTARTSCLKTFQDAFKPPLNTVLELASTDVWDRASEVGNTAWEVTEKEARKVYGETGLGFTAERTEDAVQDDIKPMCYEKALTDIKDAVGTPSNFLLRMTKRFDDEFRFDERGVPRHFGPTEDIEALFVAAREKGEELIDLLGEVKLTGSLTTLRTSSRSIDDSVAEPVILAEHLKADLREQLKRQAGAVFMEAKRAQEAAKVTTKVPLWLFGLLVILGWNEIMIVLRNPVLLLLTVIILPVLYMGYTLDAPTLLGPAVRATLNPLLEQAKTMLEQATAPEASVPTTSGLSGLSSASSSTTVMSGNEALHKD